MNGSTATAVVIDVADLDAGLAHMTDDLGFRIDRISPADAPREIDLSGHGLSVVLRRDESSTLAPDELTLEMVRDAAAGDAAPTALHLEPAVTERTMEVPAGTPTLQISHLADSADFGVGRAGMGYRDLIPDRQGGRFIASHIRIDGGGEVPDYAHFHKIRFQMIYCYRGWVRVVYEDQGDPFVLRPGDCVLQPPEIRHRVLESSPGLEVIEIGCPAEHDTYADHEITLPTGRVDADRDFGGQRFVRHVAADAHWEPWTFPGFECRRIGIAEATDGLAGVRVVRPLSGAAAFATTHDAELLLYFVLDGAADIDIGGRTHRLVSGDSVVVPSTSPFAVEIADDTEILEVSLPAQVPFS